MIPAKKQGRQRPIGYLNGMTVHMAISRVKQIHQLGHSIWLDFMDRQIMTSGTFQKLIDEDGIRGITSNPAIFENAVSGSSDYQGDIKRLARQEKTNEDIGNELALADVQRAADLLRPVYEDTTRGADGLVSLEVSPRLAFDPQGTLQQARTLWKAVDRPNVMIKIPATREALWAIRQAIREGINVSVTLLFGLDRYAAVAEAYIGGLEERAKAGQPLDQLASVASFFLSGIDQVLDAVLTERGIGELKGEVAIALAKRAYTLHGRVFASDRFKRLADLGATPQRLLWASAGTEDPSFSDVKYVEALIGPQTVNTLPMKTLDAFRDHGQAALRLTNDYPAAIRVLEQVRQAGIDLRAVAQQLEEEGLEKSTQPFDKLMQAIEQQKKGPLAR